MGAKAFMLVLGVVVATFALRAGQQAAPTQATGLPTASTTSTTTSGSCSPPPTGQGTRAGVRTWSSILLEYPMDYPADWPTTRIAGHLAYLHRESLFCDFTEAVTFAGGRGYVFTGDAGDPCCRVFDMTRFKAFLASVRFPSDRPSGRPS